MRHRGIREVVTLGRRHSRFAVWPARRVMLTGIVNELEDAHTRLETEERAGWRVGGQCLFNIEDVSSMQPEMAR